MAGRLAVIAALCGVSGSAYGFSGAWTELTGGLPTDDDISYASFGDGPDDLWIGTVGGNVWRSHDGGGSYRLAFRALEAEPVVAPRLTNLRAVNPRDFARADTPVSPRDRAGQARRASDLSGNARSRTRDRGTPLLASVVRDSVRDAVAVEKVTACHGAIYVLTTETLWRSTDRGVRFEALGVGPTSPTGEIGWVSCDHTRPGRLAVNTRGGVYESFDGGETFLPFGNPPPRSLTVQTANFGSRGQLLVMLDQWILEEVPAERRYRRVCRFAPDSADSARPRWAWFVEGTPDVYQLTADGILWCREGRTQRLAAPRMMRTASRYLWIDDADPRHIYVASADSVYETRDGGDTFEEIFVRPTQRSIARIMIHAAAPDRLFVFTGSQIFRRGPTARSPWDPDRILAPLRRQAPLVRVLKVTHERLELTPGTVAARRHDLAIGNLLPRLDIRVSHLDRDGDDGLVDNAAPNRDIVGLPGNGQTIWAALLTWDLARVVFDEDQTRLGWAEIELLRQRITYRVQDTYALWLRASAGSRDPELSSEQRAQHEIWRREAAAYLDHMTGGAFAVFARAGELG